MCFAKILNVMFVCGAEAFRNEAVKQLSDRIFGREEEHSFSGAIKEDDALLVINRDDGVHSRADYTGKLLLAAAQFLFGLLGLRNVRDGNESQRLAVRFVDDAPTVTEYSPPILIDTPDAGFVVGQVFAGNDPSQRPLFQLQHGAIEARQLKDLLKLGKLQQTLLHAGEAKHFQPSLVPVNQLSIEV